jgi:hypothetical protein
MSYSFTIRGATAADALAQVTTELNNVVLSQPIHADDARITLATAEGLLSLLEEDLTRDVKVDVNGSCWTRSGNKLEQTNIGLSIALVPKTDT